MIIAGYILALLGLIVCLVGEAMLIVVSYKRGLGCQAGTPLAASLVSPEDLV